VTTAVSADWVLPVDGPPIADAHVAWEDGHLVEVGPGRAERHFDGAVILPAFVNAHSHLEYAVYVGFGDGLAFGPWLETHIRRKGQIGLPEMEAIARLGAAQCLASGIGTVGDASFSGAAATACAELGLRAIVYLEVFGRDTEDIGGRFETARDRLEGTLPAEVRLGISPHAPYTCSTELYAACFDLDLPVATHLAESVDEQAWLRGEGGTWERYADLLVPPLGTTGIRSLAANGLLDERVVGAHCVHVDDEEIALLARHDVAVAHCPRSNGYLGCGVAPLRALLDGGVRIGIGTDSPASTPSFDMFDELRAAIVGARARERRPDALAASEALELATIGGARSLGLDDEIGTLTPGKQADLTVVSLAGTPYLPWEDPASAVVLGGSPEQVTATLVAGRPRYRRGGMEWHELTGAAHNARGRMLHASASTSSP